jgi:RNA ligase (TIGR02306 family)
MITDIYPIENADNIEVAVINGWEVVVLKDTFMMGEIVVYFELDSWIPHTLAPFLLKGTTPRVYGGVEGARLKTIRLRGQLSQGLILPVIETPAWELDELKVGTDVTDLLGVQKWEAPIPACMGGIQRGTWPAILPKSDQERCQNLVQQITDAAEAGISFELTEKLEGTSTTMAIIQGEFRVFSKNVDLCDTEENLFWRMARQYDVATKLRNCMEDGIAIQAEVVGEGIQGNIYKIKGQKMFVYDLYNINKGAYADPRLCREAMEIIGLDHVPVLSTDLFLEFNVSDHPTKNIKKVLEMADGMSLLYEKTPREGIVFKSNSLNGYRRMSFKAISNNYLIKSK